MSEHVSAHVSEQAGPSSSSAASVRVSSRQPAADRDATIASVLAALIAPSGIAGAWGVQCFVRADADGDFHATALKLGVVVAVAFPLACSYAADRVAARALSTTELPLRRARIVRRVALPFAFVGAITALLVALAVPFATLIAG